MTSSTHLDEERQQHRDFATQHADPRYQPFLKALHQRWNDLSVGLFGGQMQAPHIALGKTSGRSLGCCEETTDYGGRLLIVLNRKLVFGKDARWVVRRNGEGHRRAVQDLLLRCTLCQYQIEIAGQPEPGKRGYGRHFCARANGLRDALGLVGPVRSRRRGGEGDRVAAFWPHCVRPEGYYGADITDRLLALLTGRKIAKETGPGAGPSPGFLHLVGSYLDGGQDELRRLLERHRERLEAKPRCGWPACRKAVAKPAGGSSPEVVRFAPEWLEARGGVVRRLLEAITQYRNYGEVPFLAEALEAAGCPEGEMLAHLRERAEHGKQCWVLRGLLNAGS